MEPDMKKFTIAISPGHTAINQGASRGPVTEYGLTCEIIGRATRLFSEAGHICHLIGSASNSVQIARINDIAPDFGLELHFNNMASKPEWNGSLCMHSGSEKGQDLASSVNHAVANILRTKNRGIFIGHHRLNKKNRIIEMIRLTRCTWIIIEPCYLSNTDDFNKIDTAAIARAVFNGCCEFWSGVQG